MRVVDTGNADNEKMNWDNIETITEFDDINIDEGIHVTNRPGGGSGDGTTSSSRYSDQKNISELAAGKPTTSTSLLIESLVQLLCLILEDDHQLSDQSYRAICEQLEKINLIDESYAMKEFEEMRSQYQMQIYKIIRAVGGHEIPKSLPTIATLKTQPIETCWSRYHREFEEVEFIAGGGFGKVFKARHKLDCIEYAIKQIKIHSTTIKLCHLAEVKTIASLNHPNIVQYKAAWLEPFVPEKNSSKMLQSESCNLSDTATNVTQSKLSNSSNGTSSATNDLSMRRPSTNQDESSDFIEFERSQEHTGTSNTTNSCNQVICKYESNSMEESFCTKPKLAILYIQMSLCQLTLRQWLDNRNASSSLDEFYFEFFENRTDICHYDIVHDIFCQILAGVNYIHSKNIIHHDIKPSNIFLELDADGRLTAQLGDFGLACPLQNGHRGIALGTPMYAAPEQLLGECNPKSDIFSLGIVLIELLMKFGTDMERVRTIENARNGTLPPMLNKKSTKLLQSLLSHERIRPQTKDLMEIIRKINLEQNLRAFRATSEVERQAKETQIIELLNQINVLRDTTETINRERETLQLKVREQNHEIAELKCSVFEKDSEIAVLRMQLEKLQKS